MIGWSYEKDALLYERVMKRDWKLGQDRLRKRSTRARKIWSPNTNTNKSLLVFHRPKYKYCEQPSIRSSSEFISVRTKVPVSRDNKRQRMKVNSMISTKGAPRESSDNRKYVAKKDEY